MVLSLRQQNALNAVGDPIVKQNLRRQFQAQNNNGARSAPRNATLPPRSRRGRMRIAGRFAGTNQVRTRLQTRVAQRQNMNNASLTTYRPAPLNVGTNRNTNQGGFITINRTFLFEPIASRTAFNVGNNIIAPGMFPWLLTMAKLYDQYKWTKVRVRYTPTCSTAREGTVFYGFMYDNSSSVTMPNNLLQAQGVDKFTMTSPWQPGAWITVSPRILMDKWYDCQGSEPGSHNLSPVSLLAGVDKMTDQDVPLGFMEADVSIMFGRPTYDFPSGGNLDSSDESSIVEI